MDILINIFILLLYIYYVYQIGDIEKGKLKKYILFIIISFVMFLANFFDVSWLSWIIDGIVIMLFGMFYDSENFKYQWWQFIIPSVALMFVEIAISNTEIVDSLSKGEIIVFLMLIMIARKRECLNYFNGVFIAILYIFIVVSNTLISTYYEGIFKDTEAVDTIKLSLFCISIFIFILLEGTLKSYQTGYEIKTKAFQQDVLKHQYNEIKNIYMDMRGWRHDYHNHLQVIKAYMSRNEYTEVNDYLDELEKDLDKVDTYVKSGNMMIDAILNSKLSIAEKNDIKIYCKANVPEDIKILEIDLCVILGNLLDNAVEACEKIEKDKRFIRIYIVVNKKQFYISVQNSAKEELNFNERNYITNKRGNHGFGMKRVKILIDKYDGFLNLKNEPGIFASEVMIPLI